MLLQDVLMQLKELAEGHQTDGRALLLDSRSYVPPQLDDVQDPLDGQVCSAEAMCIDALLCLGMTLERACG